MMQTRIRVASTLFVPAFDNDFINIELPEGVTISPGASWSDAIEIAAKFMPVNCELYGYETITITITRDYREIDKTLEF